MNVIYFYFLGYFLLWLVYNLYANFHCYDSFYKEKTSLNFLLHYYYLLRLSYFGIFVLVFLNFDFGLNFGYYLDLCFHLNYWNS